MKTKDQQIQDALEELNELEKLLTERISDMYEIKGMMQARHAYIFYRQKVYNTRDILKKIQPTSLP